MSEELGQMNNLNVDTKIMVFKEIITIEKDGQKMDTTIFEDIILTSEKKKLMMEGLAKGYANGYKHPLLLVPISYLSKKTDQLTYPIAFMNTPTYFVPYIREVIVLECD